MGLEGFCKWFYIPSNLFFKKPLDAENNDIKPRVMEKYTNEELLEVLPVGLKETKEVTSKQKLVLGQLYIYNGLNKKDSEGFFYRSNKDLSADCGIEEKTVIAAIRKLTTLELIETKRGSRASGASMYRVNEDRLKEYCNTNTVNYSEDYSKQIVEMADRIKELENTVKRLVDRITVIETANYSTDTDKELEKEKEINNNIIYNNYNNILEETERIEEVEEGKSEEKPLEYQLVITESLSTPVQNESQPILTESQASSPIEELSQASPVTNSTGTEYTHASTEDESIPAEQQTIPTEEEQFQQWLQIVSPYLNQLEDITTLAQYDNIKNRVKEVGYDYIDSHDVTSPTVIERMNKTALSALREKKKELLPDEMSLSDYLRVHNQGSLRAS